MSDARKPILTRWTVEIAPDRMEAWLRPPQERGSSPVTLETLLETLQSAGIPISAPVRARCEEIQQAWAAGPISEERLSVTQGTPAMPAQDAVFTWHEALQQKCNQWLNEEHVDYRQYNSIVTVDKGTVLGVLTPPVPAQDGVDVCGQALKGTGVPQDIALSDTVGRDPANPTVIHSRTPGRAVVDHGVLKVREVVEVPGDVDFSSGNVDSAVDVAIRGTVMDLFAVKSQHSITIGGAVQAAEITAGGDVIVRGGILGRQKGRVTAGGGLTAKYAEDANLICQGDMNVSKGAMNSRVRAEGRLLSIRGAIIGGDVYAREGIEVAAIGSEACVPTTVATGIHVDVIRQADEMTESLKPQRQAVERIRTTVEPLLKDKKRLTPSQKERATELMFQADTLEDEIRTVERNRDTMLQEARARANPYVLVSKSIHSRSVVRIGHRQVYFEKDYPGPVRIEMRKIEGSSEIVSVNQLSGSITVLPSALVSAEAPKGQAKRQSTESCKA